MVGYIPGLQPKFKDMTNFVNGRWKGIQVRRVHMRNFGVFLYVSQSKEKMEEVLQNRWFFQGQPLILQPWRPEMDLEDMSIDSVPVWVKFHNLHFSFWRPQALRKVASYLGTPIKTDKLTTVRGKIDYARMLIDVKIADILPGYIPIKTPYGMYKQIVEFEWKPIKCSLCGKIGHTKEECKKAVDIAAPEGVKTAEAPSEVVVVNTSEAPQPAPVVKATTGLLANQGVVNDKGKDKVGVATTAAPTPDVPKHITPKKNGPPPVVKQQSNQKGEKSFITLKLLVKLLPRKQRSQ